MTRVTRPRVSVIVPVYRAEGYLEASVRSALAQPETDEVVLVEDGSDDSSFELCGELAAAEPDRIRLVTHPGRANRGAGAARNLGMATARNDLIAFLDADDLMLAERFSSAVRQLATRPEIGGVFDPVIQVESSLPSIPPAALTHGVVLPIPDAADPAGVLERLLAPVPGTIHLDGLVVRRRSVERVGPMTERPLMEDMEWIWRLTAAATLAPGEAARPVAVYRIHPGNRATPVHPTYTEEPYLAALSAYRWARHRRRLVPRAARRLLRRLLCHNIGLWRGAPIPFWQLRRVQLRRWLGAATSCPEVLLSWRIWLHGMRFRYAPSAPVGASRA